jgi:hypothetical protein
MQQTLGQKRVRTSFNPSAENLVDQAKDKGADFIDFCESIKLEINSGEKIRLISLAQTASEEATMWLVKAITI